MLRADDADLQHLLGVGGIDNTCCNGESGLKHGNAERTYNVLFLCTGNSARSILVSLQMGIALYRSPMRK